MPTHPANEFPLSWRQGEHVTVVGDTGTGKSYLISRLVRLREYVVFFRTKPDDIKLPGFKTVRKASAMNDWHNERILLDPVYSRQAIEGYEMLDRAWKMGGWTIVVDEHWYTERLGLKTYVERLLTQGRSKGISVVIGIQRPVEISRFTISQSTHLFAFRIEGRDLKTVAASTTPRIVAPVESLRGFDFIYYNRARRVIAKGNARILSRVMVKPTKNKSSTGLTEPTHVVA